MFRLLLCRCCAKSVICTIYILLYLDYYCDNKKSMQNSIFIYILLYLNYYYNRIINLLCNKSYLHSTIFKLLPNK